MMKRTAKNKKSKSAVHQPALVAVDQSKVAQGRKKTQGKQKQSNYVRWPCMEGVPIVEYLMVGKELYPYTAVMLKRREERLKEQAAKPPERELTLQEISQALWDELGSLS